jgi:hypothetical protein
MNKILAALLALAMVAAFSTTPASAQRALGAAIAGGILGGVIVGGAVAASQAPPPVYVEGPGCHFERQRWWDGYEWRFRRIQVCP